MKNKLESACDELPKVVWTSITAYGRDYMNSNIIGRGKVMRKMRSRRLSTKRGRWSRSPLPFHWTGDEGTEGIRLKSQARGILVCFFRKRNPQLRENLKIDGNNVLLAEKFKWEQLNKFKFLITKIC